VGGYRDEESEEKAGKVEIEEVRERREGKEGKRGREETRGRKVGWEAASAPEGGGKLVLLCSIRPFVYSRCVATPHRAVLRNLRTFFFLAKSTKNSRVLRSFGSGEGML
jgi:hypothetical protein